MFQRWGLWWLLGAGLSSNVDSSLLDLAPNFPVDQPMQVVEDEVLVCLDVGVGLGDTQVDSGGVDELLVLRLDVLIVLGQVEVAAERVNGLLDSALLVVEQAKLQVGVSLRLPVVLLLVGEVAELLEVSDGGVDVTVFGVHLTELLVRLQHFLLALGGVLLFADGQELVEQFDGLSEVAELLVDVSHLLVALRLLLAVLGGLSGG